MCVCVWECGLVTPFLQSVLVGLNVIWVVSWTPLPNKAFRKQIHITKTYFICCARILISYSYLAKISFVHFLFNYYYYCLKQILSQCDKLLLEHQFSLTPIKTWKFGDSLLKFMCVTKCVVPGQSVLTILFGECLISCAVQFFLFTDS